MTLVEGCCTTEGHLYLGSSLMSQQLVDIWLIRLASPPPPARRVCCELGRVFKHFVCEWKDEPVYSAFLIYLFQVENWCPRLPWRAKNPYEEADHNSLVNGCGALFLPLGVQVIHYVMLAASFGSAS